MAGNHVLLETISLTQSAASVTFDNIPQSGYTDLKVVASVRSDYSGQAIALRINPNGSGANMTAKVLLGSGSAASSFSDTIAYASSDANTSTANTYNNVEWYIPNYTSSSNKSISVDFVTETNASAAIMGLSAGLWSSSSAITSLDILTTAGNLMAYSTFSLYGVAATGTTPVTAPLATGGNIVANDGTYWYHAFLSSGFFTPQTPLTCDAIVVAGGGAGGNIGGGGGAGGLLAYTSQSLTATNYTVTIGAGAATNSASTFGGKGSNSQLGALTAAVGGGNGGSEGVNNGIGSSGGSGGGGGGYPSAVGGLPTSGQGNEGGTAGNTNGGGGGGGASAVGANGNVRSGGNGGVGTSTYSSWGSATSTGELSSSTYYFAGGGGGSNYDSGTVGIGGLGGGGTAGTYNGANGTAGLANTGGGGGAGQIYGSNSPSGQGKNGGSGIVIIRYAMV